MGWLQGLRFRNEQEMKQGWEHTHLTSKSAHDHEANVIHVENIRNTSTKDSSLPVRDDVPNNTNVNNNVHCPNEIEALLAATFEQPKTRDQKLADHRAERAVASYWPFQDEEVKDEDLPHISRDEIISKKLTIGKDGLISETHSEGLWIVVEDIVYDCSSFVDDHPGGKQVILSFVGEDCSWQFWRFHSRSVMDEHGKSLRIGRAEKIPNRFEERPKYVGLSHLGHDEYY